MRKKVIVALFIVIIISFLSGCSELNKSSQNTQHIPINQPVDKLKIPIIIEEYPQETRVGRLKQVANIQGITIDEVINHDSFLGGTIGSNIFHGGEVLMWNPNYEEEPLRFRVKATLDLGDGIWRNTSVTYDIVVNHDEPFIATVAILNDGDEKERIVPLRVFFGYVNDPNIKKVRVRRTGFSYLETSVVNKTWLIVHQGLINEEITYEAINDGYDILYTKQKD